MAHFAELDENNIVLRVIVVHNNELFDGEENESEQLGIDYCVAHYGGQWIQTSYNANFRKNYAGAGFTYDAIADVFIPPKPYPSWLLDSNHNWQAPTPQPLDVLREYTWNWNEEILDWEADESGGDPASVI